MFDKNCKLMRGWDTRGALGEVNGFLAAFAHLNSHQINRGYEQVSCDFGMTEVERLVDIEMSVLKWLRPSYRSGERSLKSLAVEAVDHPHSFACELLRRWLFRHTEPHNESWRSDLAADVASRIMSFQDWTAVYRVEAKPLPGRMMDAIEVAVLDCETQPGRCFALTFSQWTVD